MKKEKTKEQTITGNVIPAEWDDDDNVIQVAIQTEDYDEYLVEHNGKGKELLAFIDYNVEATGTVRQRKDGELTISVKRYESLGEYEEEAYVEDEDYEHGYREDEEDQLL
jgi:lysyl-tRNA synthetase class II